MTKKKKNKLKKVAKVVAAKEVLKKEVPAQVPLAEVPENKINVLMTREEIQGIVRLLTFNHIALTQLAEAALKTEDKESIMQFASNAKITQALAAKFSMIADIGEPTNRNIH